MPPALGPVVRLQEYAALNLLGMERDCFNHVAADPNRRPEDPNPPRFIVVFFTDGRLVADLAT
jgi:hypothetical protein